ncbi:MAG TPA: Stp1/IreP family PP2C-type Ser/Thr phosphatase [Clostridia bacterium]|nr:Stp1/IreP family PP2C-type Ser/Thr phosphatase [Clostridia bacterium]
MVNQSILYAGMTHRGLVREHNEDSFALDAGEREWPLVFVVADGLGGHQHGELASLTAVEYVVPYLKRHLPQTNDPESVKLVLEDALQKTNVKVYTTSLEDDENVGMGTTMTLAVFYARSCYLAHIGDTRCYLLRENTLEQLTEDDTYVGQMVAMGSLTASEVSTHPKRHVLTQALGYPEYVEPEIVHVDLLGKDRFLLSSDGLHGVLSSEAIAKALRQAATPEDAATSLIEQTLQAGAPDNVTAVVIFA